MKGPRHGPPANDNTDSEWIVGKARNCLSLGDDYAAKSWLLTAKTLFPNSFNVQYEAFQMERRAGKMPECGKLFYEMLQSFPNEAILRNELRRLVLTQDSHTQTLDDDSKFLKGMFESLSTSGQRELLLLYADHQSDLVERCRISLVVMRKFHGAIREYGVKLIKTLAKAEKKETWHCPLNIYRKMIVCDVLPLVLKSSEVQMESSNPKHKSSVSYVSERQLMTWLEWSIEFYIAYSVDQSSLKVSSSGDKSPMESAHSLFDSEGGLSHSPWQMLHDMLVLFAGKCGWTNVLKLKDKIDPSKSRTIKSRWKTLSNAKDSKGSSRGLFYCVLDFYFYAVIEYCKVMNGSAQKGLRDMSNEQQFVLLESIDHMNQKESVQQSVIRIPKKKRKLEEGTVSLGSSSEPSASSEDVNIHFCSSVGGQMNSLVTDCLQVAVDCWNFFMSSDVFEDEYYRISSEWRIHTWEWMESFSIDSMLYQRKYRDIIEKRLESSTGALLTIKQYLQMASCLYCIGEHKDACRMALQAVKTITSEEESTNWRGEAHKAILPKDQGDGRCILALPCSQNEVMAFCIQLLVSCLRERLTCVDVRPDTDKIGPVFDIRQDNIIGHLIVLLQFNWPQGEDLFELLVKSIKTLGGLKYEQFFKYVTNIDILEEFAYLNTLEKVQLELLSATIGETNRKTVTRGVNRENKEDFRTAMDLQVARSSEPIHGVILNFLQEEHNSLLNS